MSPSSDEKILTLVTTAIRTALDERHLSDEEVQWVKLAIQKEAQSIKLRQAIIEKTLAGLVWMGILGIVAVFWEYALAHGWKR